MPNRFASIVPFVALAVLSAGCDNAAGDGVLQGPSAGAGGRISFALSGDYVPGSTAFQVRLYKGAPDTLARNAYFTSPCTPPNVGFTVTDLDIGPGYLVVYDAFSAADCGAGTLVARGVRGEIEVTKEGTGNAVYYIQVNALGQVNPFPMPPANLASSGVSCETDVECQGTVDCPDRAQCTDPFQQQCGAAEECVDGMKWVQYRVHPSATCVGGTCRLESLFPLNTREHRSFHVAATAPDGDVVMVGGFTQAGGVGLSTGTVASTEAFDSDTSLFRLEDLGLDLGTATGLMGATTLDNGRLVLVGGSPTVGAEVDGSLIVPVPRPETCQGGACTLVVSPYAFVVDLAGGTATRSEPGFSTAAALVTGIEGPGVFVRTGLVQQGTDQVVAGSASYRCVPDVDDALSCVQVPGSESAAPRYLATSACLARSAGGCTDVVVLGGNVKTAPFGEWFSTATGQVKNLVPAGGVPETLFGATAVVAGGQVWTFGGGSGKVPNQVPVAFNIDPDTGTITGSPATLDAAGQALMTRAFHQATPLADGQSVLITGGVDATGKPLASVVLVTVASGRLSVKSVLHDMGTARLQHQATLVRGGLLDGAVVITGGLSGVTGSLKFAGGAEIFVP
jgi:hypothetical protein